MTPIVPSHEPAAIGRFYMVPCILVPKTVRTKWTSCNGGWVPILGPEHEDAEHIGFVRNHYHVDVRFVSAPVYKKFGLIHHPLALPLTTGGGAWDMPGREQEIPRPEMRRLQAKRSMPIFPRSRATWMGKLEDAHADCELKPGGICPHRGIPLAPFADADGNVVCPGHGLKFNLSTGRLIREDS